LSNPCRTSELSVMMVTSTRTGIHFGHNMGNTKYYHLQWMTGKALVSYLQYWLLMTNSHAAVALFLNWHSWCNVMTDTKHLQNLTKAGVATTNQNPPFSAISIYWMHHLEINSQDSRLDDWGVRVQVPVQARHSDQLWGPPNLLYNGYQRLLSWGVKWQGHEVGHLPPPGIEINGGAIPLYPHVFIAWGFN
jgi:hypothetical protein